MESFYDGPVAQVSMSTEEKGRESGTILNRIHELLRGAETAMYLSIMKSLRDIASELSRGYLSRPVSEASGKSTSQIRNPKATQGSGRPDEGTGVTDYFRKLKGNQVGAKKTRRGYTCSNCHKQHTRGICGAICVYCSKHDCPIKGEKCRKRLAQQGRAMLRVQKRLIEQNMRESNWALNPKLRLQPPGQKGTGMIQ